MRLATSQLQDRFCLGWNCFGLCFPSMALHVILYPPRSVGRSVLLRHFHPLLFHPVLFACGNPTLWVPVAVGWDGSVHDL